MTPKSKRGPAAEPRMVAPGVWAIPLPFPSPLGYSFSYAIEVAAGTILVDLGWNSDRAWSALLNGLATSGARLENVVGVIITHTHSDHFGLARRVKESTDAWIAGHPAESPGIVQRESERPSRVATLQAWLLACGVPLDVLDEMRSESIRLVESLGTVEFDFSLVSGDPVPSTEGSLTALHTPGHSPGHLCFLDRARHLAFTGDHVLPRVSPNISKRPWNGFDPLGDYLNSLTLLGDSIRSESPMLALPGHEWEFADLAHRTAQLDKHHRERLDEILRIFAGKTLSIWETASALPWSREFGSFDARGKRQAVGETHAHVYRLEQARRLEVVADSPWRWRLSS